MNDISLLMAAARNGFEDDLARLIEKKGLSRAKLARALDVKPPLITKTLSGTNNHTLRTMARFADAVGAVLEIRLADKDSEFVRVVDKNLALSIDAETQGVSVATGGDRVATVTSIASFRERLRSSPASNETVPTAQVQTSVI